MPLFMLDTNAASAVIKGHEQAEKRLRALPMDGWCISAVTRSELRFGLELKPEATRLAMIVNAWLELAPVAPQSTELKPPACKPARDGAWSEWDFGGGIGRERAESRTAPA